MLVNGHTFPASGAAQFLTSLKLLAPTTDKAPNLKKEVSAVLRGAERMVEALGGESATLKGLRCHPETHSLGETFFSQAPILFGPYRAKVSVAPVSAELMALTGAKPNVNGHPNGLPDAVLDFFPAPAARSSNRRAWTTSRLDDPRDPAAQEAS